MIKPDFPKPYDSIKLSDVNMSEFSRYDGFYKAIDGFVVRDILNVAKRDEFKDLLLKNLYAWVRVSLKGEFVMVNFNLRNIEANESDLFKSL